MIKKWTSTVKNKKILAGWLRKIADEVDSGEILDAEMDEDIGLRVRPSDEDLRAQRALTRMMINSYSLKIKLRVDKKV